MTSRGKDDWLSLSYKQRRAFTHELIRIHGAVCCICGLPIAPGTESCQHLTPRSKGGRTTLENCRPAHRSCNYALKDNHSDGPAGVIHDGLAALVEAASRSVFSGKD